LGYAGGYKAKSGSTGVDSRFLRNFHVTIY
jgi:hypothetical protein